FQMEVCSARIAWSRRCGWDVLTSRSSRLKETTLATRCGLALWPVSGWKKSIPSLCSAKAWDQLSPQERPDCAIFAQNYGQAGAIDFLGRRYGLPPALSGHQTYFLWGPRKYSGKCMIVLTTGKNAWIRCLNGWSSLERRRTILTPWNAMSQYLSAKARSSARSRKSGHS